MKTKGIQKFIVLSAPRSGSNHLIHFLDSHPSITCFGEPFQPNFLLGNPSRTMFENPVILFLYKFFRATHPIFFLNHIIFKQYPEQISAVGFKIFYEHANLGNMTQVWSYLKRSQKLKIIHLQRKNILKSYVSLLVAFKTGNFISYSNATDMQDSRIILDYHLCKKYFTTVEAWRAEYDHMFSKKHIMHIYYEDLCNDTTNVLLEVQKFLGVAPELLVSPVMKQSTRPLHQTIKNYSELKRQFAQSRWAHFFDE